jgi:hypothetical protein
MFIEPVAAASAVARSVRGMAANGSPKRWMLWSYPLTDSDGAGGADGEHGDEEPAQHVEPAASTWRSRTVRDRGAARRRVRPHEQPVEEFSDARFPAPLDEVAHVPPDPFSRHLE